MSSTTEDYLKRILAESERTGEQVVSLGRLASLAAVTAGTVTSMMKRLEGEGLVNYLPRRGVQLTESGHRSAGLMLRRHRLIELFLVEVLGLDWADVHSEAEVLEHSISDRILERIDELLGFPATDPHGDPIPGADGRVAATEGVVLSGITHPGNYVISRVTHDEPAFLAYLKTEGLVPGVVIRMEERDDQAMTVHLAVGDQRVTLSLAVANRILVART